MIMFEAEGWKETNKKDMSHFKDIIQKWHNLLSLMYQCQASVKGLSPTATNGNGEFSPYTAQSNVKLNVIL